MVSRNPEIYTKKIKVKKEHIDYLNHVNNAVYLQWIQEVAGEHWTSKFGAPDPSIEYWVVLEHHIKYKKQAFIDEILRVETNVTTPQGLKFPREVRFYRGEELIVESTTLWVWIDGKSHRPKRITTEVLDIFGI